MSYTNADGLYVLNGVDQAAEQDKGTTVNGIISTIVVDIPSFAAIGSSFGASNIDPNDPVIPANAVITNADLVMSVAATSGGAATLTIGTYTAAGAAVDADGIDATIALTAIDAIGDVVQCDGAQVNGLVTVGTAACHIGLIYGTAVFTAGAGKLIVQYYVP